MYSLGETFTLLNDYCPVCCSNTRGYNGWNHNRTEFIYPCGFTVKFLTREEVQVIQGCPDEVVEGVIIWEIQ